MNDQDLRDLLNDAVVDVEPGYALDAIRARTKPARPRWPYAAGATILAVAASLTAFAVLGNEAPPRALDPATTTSASPSPDASPTPSDPPSTSATEVPSKAAAVYYIGDTPDGPRLYREFQQVPGKDLLNEAIAAAVNARPVDPDYYSGWPQGAFLGASVEGGVIQVRVGKPAIYVPLRDYAIGVAEMAVQQIIYTAQAAVQERLPVQFVYRGNPVAQVLGYVPTSEPLAEGPALDTLALVSLTTPSEGMVVDNDKPLVVEGVGNSFEGNIVTRVQRWEGTAIVDEQAAISGMGEGKLFPFSVSLDLSKAAPGDYVVISQTDDPSGNGHFHSDTRRITVVD